MVTLPFKKLPTDAPARPAVPTLSEASPAYAALVARRVEIQLDIRSTNTKRDQMIAERNARLATVDEGRKDRAQRIIEGQPVSGQAMDADEFSRTLSGLSRHQGDLQEALRLIESQIERERMNASAIIRARIADGHRTMVRAMALKLIELHKLSREYTGLARELNDKEVAWSELGPHQMTRMLGLPDERESAAGRYLREAVEGGFLDAKELPAEFA